MARQEYTVGRRAYSGSARAVREAYMNPLISPYAIILQSSLYSQQKAENFLNTSNRFHTLEMATFVPISYTYVPTAPRSTSATARRKLTSKQSGIFNKLQRSKLSEAELSTPLPAAANDIGSDEFGIQGMLRSKCLGWWQ